ncbi:MAG: hypothetical protein HYT71_03235 [Candidatus Aenigmarchaeota archaeon]|nr:hypothetical protein [Candidatus Aenigmarchaeota archaeon]
MVSQKAIIGFLMVAVGAVALGAEYIKNYISIPFADVWLTALIIVIAGTLPALLIVFGSVIIWGELEEKRAERGISNLEKKLIRRKKKR